MGVTKQAIFDALDDHRNPRAQDFDLAHYLTYIFGINFTQAPEWVGEWRKEHKYDPTHI